MKTITIIIKDITAGTFTNTDAVPLRIAIDKVLSNGNSIILSFKDVNAVSSSFLNSSIGEIIDLYGFSVLKDRIKITHYTSNIAAVIKKYVTNMRDSKTAT